MPIQFDRADEVSCEPLQRLQLSPETELYLGLGHTQDGVEGTLKRIEAARKCAPRLGIACECGISRGRDRNVAGQFLTTYAGAAAAMDRAPAVAGGAA